MDNPIIIAALIVAATAVLVALIPVLLKSLTKGSRGEGSQKAFSTEDIFLRTFFQGNLHIVQETILIVVGTSIGAERYDRVLAQHLKRILHNGNIEAEIITDILYQKEIQKFEASPVIAIGRGSRNQLVNVYEEEFELKDRETTAKVFTDGQRPIAFIYGGGVKETYEATIDFCKNKLVVFVDKWSYRYTEGRKTVEIPSNIEDSLKEIIFTMSSFVKN